MNFRTGFCCVGKAEIRVEPVAAWVRVFLGDDIYLIAHLELIGERHNASAHFGTDTTMTDFTVNGVGKIQRRGACGQIYHFTFRRKDIHAIIKHLAA